MASREESAAQRAARRALNQARRQANAEARAASPGSLKAMADALLKSAPSMPRRLPQVPPVVEARPLSETEERIKAIAQGFRSPAKAAAALTPDARTAATIASMSKFASMTAADGLAGATVRPFLADLAAHIVRKMRANVRAGGAENHPIADGTLLTRFDNREKDTPLNDTGRMALALSADFHADTSKRFALRIGPLGRTPWSKQARFKTIDADERPDKLPTGATGSVGFLAEEAQRGAAAAGRGGEVDADDEAAAGGGAATQKSKLTYAEVAWMHELGWSFKVTEPMAKLFQALGGFNNAGGRMNQGHPVFGAGAALLYGVMTVSLGEGMGRAPAIGKVITVPARPFMQPAMEESANLVASRWPAISAQVFNDWIATGPTRKRLPDKDGKKVFLEGHVAMPRDFVAFASPIGAAMRRKALARLRASP